MAHCRRGQSSSRPWRNSRASSSKTRPGADTEDSTRIHACARVLGERQMRETHRPCRAEVAGDRGGVQLAVDDIRRAEGREGEQRAAEERVRPRRTAGRGRRKGARVGRSEADTRAAATSQHRRQRREQSRERLGQRGRRGQRGRGHGSRESRRRPMTRSPGCHPGLGSALSQLRPRVRCACSAPESLSPALALSARVRAGTRSPLSRVPVLAVSRPYAVLCPC